MLKFFRRSTLLLLMALALGSMISTALAQDEESAAPSPILETLAPLPAATGGVAVDTDGNIFVADIGIAPSRNGQTVYKVTPEGEVSIFVQDSAILGASGNAFDSEGNLYQSSLRRNTISKITPEGELSTFATASEGLLSPVGIYIDEEDTLYVANCGGASVLVINSQGELIDRFNSFLFNCANGISLDEDKNIYVANFNNGNVLKIDAETEEISVFVTVPGNNNGHLFYAGGFFYMAARGGARIYTLSLEGELEVFAAIGVRGHVDGPALEGQISLPNDLGLSPDGNILYFNDGEPTTGTANQPSFLKRIIINPDADSDSSESNEE